MAKLITLRWKDDSGAVITENVELLEDDDEVFLFNEEGFFKATLRGPDGSEDTFTVGSIVTESVLFEDDQGFFGLRPDQILEIIHR